MDPTSKGPATRWKKRLVRFACFFAVTAVLWMAPVPGWIQLARATLSALEFNNALLEGWFTDEYTYSTVYWEYLGIRPSLSELQRRKAIYRQGHPIPFEDTLRAVGPTSYTLASATPTLPFLGNQMLVSDQPTPDGTAFSSAALRRMADCSLTETVFEPVNDLFDPTSYLELPGAQNFFHNLSGLSTTPSVFAHGCVDSALGKRSVGTSLPIGTGGTNVSIVAGLDPVTEQLKIRSLNGVTHATTTTTLTTGRVHGIAVADMNGDGLNDIVAAGVGYGAGFNGNVVVYLNNGDGTFRTATTIPNNGSRFTLDDVNGDGKVDLVIDNGYDANGTAVPGVTTLLGNGDGTFRTGVVSATTVTQAVFGPFVTGDFNGDGKPDLLLGTQVLLNRGDGSFVAGPVFPAAVQAVIGFYAAVGDFNGDGKLDVVTSGTNGGLVQILIGAGDGTFTLGARYASLPGGQQVTVTDLDGDGNLDIFVGTSSQGLYLKDRDDPMLLQMQYLLGRGDGTFVAAPVYGGTYAQNTSAPQIAVADFDSDGKLDALVVDDVSSRTIQLLPGTGRGGFGTPVRSTIAVLPMMIASADLDGDGKPDAIVAGYTTSAVPQLAVLTNQGGGRFVERDYALSTFPASIAVGDFDGDGRMDVAVGTGSNIYANTGPTGVYVLFGQADGTLSSPVRVDASVLPVSIAAADVNGDGRADLLVADQGTPSLPGSLHVYLGKADRTFTAAAPPPATSATRYTSVAFGDLNGDGKRDLVVAGAVPGASFGAFTNNLYTFLGNGDGTFQTALVEQLLGGDGNGANTIAVADFNNDGHADVAVGNQADFTEVLIGVGDGTYNHALLALAEQPSTIVAADLDNDHFPELLVGVAGVGTAVFRNAGTADAWTSASAPVTPASPTSGDFTFTASPAMASIVAGQSTQTIVAAMPANTFAQTVTLSCSGLPSGASCVFSPTSLSLANGTAASSSLTIRTSASALASLHLDGGFPSGAFVATVGGASLFARRRRTRNRMRFSKWLGLLALFALLASCGSDDGGGTTGPAPTGPVSTTYPVTITATGAATSHTATFLLTVH